MAKISVRGGVPIPGIAPGKVVEIIVEAVINRYSITTKVMKGGRAVVIEDGKINPLYTIFPD